MGVRRSEASMYDAPIMAALRKEVREQAEHIAVLEAEVDDLRTVVAGDKETGRKMWLAYHTAVAIEGIAAERDRLRGWIETRPCTCVESASSDGKVWLMQRCSRCTALAPIFDMRALAALEGGDDGCS